MNPNMMPAAAAPGGAAPAEDPAAMEGPAMPGEICVPLQALAQPDETDQSTPPAVGDKSTAQVDFTVTRLSGDNAYIKLDGINGQPIEDPAEDQQDQGADEAQEEASLRQSLGGQGAGGYQ